MMDSVYSPNPPGSALISPLTADLDAGTHKITGLGTPSGNADATTKLYVDGVVAGIAYKRVRAVTSGLPAHGRVGNILTASGNGSLVSLDGVSVQVGDRVLYAPSSADIEAGIYDVTSLGSGSTPWILTRSADVVTTAEMLAGMFIVVTEGTTYADTLWELQTNDAITLNTTTLLFAMIASPGTGITRTGNVYAIDTTVVPLKSDNLSVFASTTSAQLKALLSDETGSGAAVFANSPALVTPTGIVKGDVGLGNVDNTSNATERAAARTLTNARITKRSNSQTTTATLAPNVDNYNLEFLTAQNGNLAISAPAGTPVVGDELWIAITNINASAPTLSWNAAYKAASATPGAIPGTGPAQNKTAIYKFMYLANWEYIGYAGEF